MTIDEIIEKALAKDLRWVREVGMPISIDDLRAACEAGMNSVLQEANDAVDDVRKMERRELAREILDEFRRSGFPEFDLKTGKPVRFYKWLREIAEEGE